MAQPHDRGPELAAVTIFFLVLSACAVTLRCYVRSQMVRFFKIEDWLSVITLLCFACFSSLVLVSIKHGTGKHLADIPPEYIPLSMKWRWAAEVAWVLTSVLLKFTVGVFLLRICSKKWHTCTIWGTLTIVTLYNIFYLFIVIFQCRPVDWYWVRFAPQNLRATKLGVHSDRCFPEDFNSKPTYGSSAINAFADWTLGLLPIALVWKLNMNRRERVSLGFVLGLGSLASAATIVRFPYIYQVKNDNDPLYGFTDLAIWSTVENGLGLIASSLATLRPLFKKLFSKGPDNASQKPSSRRTYNVTSGLRSGMFCRGHLGSNMNADSSNSREVDEQYRDDLEVGIPLTREKSSTSEGRFSQSGKRNTWDMPVSPIEIGVAITRDSLHSVPCEQDWRTGRMSGNSERFSHIYPQSLM